ncbi:hypothetical protein EIK77_009202 [Talaromyces pinophilus]|nr:hypothetical protein EIK77_009202 [Talaromyces pinophilus]
MESLLKKFKSLEEGSLKTSKTLWTLLRYEALSPKELSCSCDPNMTLIWIQWDFYYSHLAGLGYEVISRGLANATAIEQLKNIDKERPTEGYTTKNLCNQCKRRNYDIKALQINYCPRYHSALEMYMEIRDLPLPTMTAEQYNAVVRSLDPDEEEFKKHDYDGTWDYGPGGYLYYPQRLQDLKFASEALRSLAYSKKAMVFSVFPS